jgi:enamine deaminase RidA (YjgF/YER057c/UK114 family)
MTHQRFRKFNTRDAYPEQTLDNDVCMVVRANNTVYVRGQTAMDLDGKIVGIGDAAAQTENAMACAKVLLEEAGSSLQDVVKIVIFITDRAYREPVYREIGKWLKGVYPCSTGLIVQGLARPEWVMEIDVDAVIPEGKSGQATSGPEWADIRLKKTKAGKRRKQTRAA